MNLFRLNRTKDESGVSGTGIVAHGVQFDNGKCVICWAERPHMPSSIGVYDSVDIAIQIHGHGGKTAIEWEPSGRASAALAEAVKVIYLGDSSDYCSSLWKIVSILAGDEAVRLLEDDERAAYERYAK